MVDPDLPVPPSGAPSVPASPGDLKVLHLASWGRRFLAFLVDSLILGAAGWTFAMPFLQVGPEGQVTGVPPALGLLGVLASFTYFWLFTAYNDGRTPGKMATGIQTVNDLGGPPTLGQAAGDAAGKALFLLIDLVIGLFVGRERRQRLTQKLVGLAVVRREAPVEQPGGVRFVKG